MSIDGTDFIINEPSPFSSQWYSHKTNGPGLRYEIGVSILGEIVWVNGPFPAGVQDLELFRSKLKPNLRRGEFVLADRGYPDFLCRTPDNLPSHELGVAAAIRARHETLNGRLKVFSVLRERYRHRKETHVLCLNSIVNITAVVLRTDPLFSLDLSI